MPYAVSHGFSPRMRIAFGPALPVGTAGEREQFDLWLTKYVPAKDAVTMLAAATPEGLGPREAGFVGGKEPSLTAGTSLAEYDLVCEEVGPEPLGEALGTLVRAGGLVVEHKGKKKVFDLTRCLPKEPRVSVAEDGATHVALTIRIGPEGSLRPEMLVTEALAAAGFPGAPKTVTRTDIVQED